MVEFGSTATLDEEPAGTGEETAPVSSQALTVEADSEKEGIQTDVANQGVKVDPSVEVASTDIDEDVWPETGPFWSLLAAAGYRSW